MYGHRTIFLPTATAIGVANAVISIHGLETESVKVLVVQDDVQRPELIVGRSYLDLPNITYYMTDGKFIIE